VIETGFWRAQPTPTITDDQKLLLKVQIKQKQQKEERRLWRLTGTVRKLSRKGRECA